MESEPEEVHRLHPLSLLFRVGSSARQLLLPAALVLFASGRLDNLYWVSAFVGVGVIHGVFHYLTYRYRFAGDELVVRGGVIFRFERHVPYARIQNIDLRQSVFHRLFRVADVRVETGSGAAAEARLQVLSLDAVDRMRERIFGERDAERSTPHEGHAAQNAGELGNTAPAHAHDAATPEHARPVASPAARSLLRLGPRELIAFGLLSQRGFVIVAAATGLALEFDLFNEQLLGLGKSLESSALDRGLGWALGVALVLGVLLAVRLLSVVWAFVNLHGFELVARGNDLQTSAGLLTRHTATIPRRRIQVVTVSAGLLQRWAGFVAVKVDTAGGSELEAQSSTRRWVAPLLRASQLPALLAELLPEFQAEALQWHDRHARAARRLFKRWVLLALFATAGSHAVFGTWGLLALPLVLVWGRVDAPVRARRAQWARGGGFFSVRHGVWGHRWRLVAEDKLQVVSVAASPFDRRWNMAGILTDTAGTTFSVQLGYLDADVARQLADALSRRASLSEFAW
ncbi:MAG: hypothetical protein DHS20C15_04550 [Planctomycetota bacterium]|nr:MAG: hypothetical protein DHS20C15_04550 [Planctomycetota bacterium]